METSDNEKDNDKKKLSMSDQLMPLNHVEKKRKKKKNGSEESQNNSSDCDVEETHNHVSGDRVNNLDSVSHDLRDTRENSFHHGHDSKHIMSIFEKQEEYMYKKPTRTEFRTWLCRKVKIETECSLQTLFSLILKRIPMLDWLINYNWKLDLIGDIIAGITVAVMHIPQGMAYAMLGGLDPISGLYMAFFPILIYACFASSRHCSMGTLSIVCLMTGKIIAEYSHIPAQNPVDPALNASVMNATIYSPAQVATIVSLGVGIWMFIFGVLNLGSLCVFLSDMLVSGFTTSAAVHVLTFQISSLFGLNIDKHIGTFKVILTWKDLIIQIVQTNPATVIVSIICISLLVLNNEIIKPRIQKLTRIPVPIELVAVVAGTLISKYAALETNFGVTVVGNIPKGLPSPQLPPFNLLGQIFMPCLTIAIVSYSVSFSMAKIFAKKKSYTLDPTQELYAIGFGNLVGSFFQCGPIAASLSRSMIQFTVGGVTQLTSFISCFIILLVLIFIGPFFETLPHSVLAAIIVTALKGMLWQVKDFWNMWKINKKDASIWMVSFLSVVVIDIDYGLFIGIVYSLLLLVLRSNSLTITSLGVVSSANIYLDTDRYLAAKEMSGIKICHVTGMLTFANQDLLYDSLIKCSGINPKSIKNKETSQKNQDKSEHISMKKSNVLPVSINDGLGIYKNMAASNMAISLDSLPSNTKESEANHKEHNSVSVSVNLDDNSSVSETDSIIVDFSGVINMDVSSAKNVASIYKEFTQAGVSLIYSSFNDSCLESLRNCLSLEDVPQHLIFLSLHDAISYITSIQCQRKI